MQKTFQFRIESITFFSKTPFKWKFRFRALVHVLFNQYVIHIDCSSVYFFFFFFTVCLFFSCTWAIRFISHINVVVHHGHRFHVCFIINLSYRSIGTYAHSVQSSRLIDLEHTVDVSVRTYPSSGCLRQRITRSVFPRTGENRRRPLDKIGRLSTHAPISGLNGSPKNHNVDQHFHFTLLRVLNGREQMEWTEIFFVNYFSWLTRRTNSKVVSIKDINILYPSQILIK